MFAGNDPEFFMRPPVKSVFPPTGWVSLDLNNWLVVDLSL